MKNYVSLQEIMEIYCLSHQTADEIIHENGCAYITDIGMTGPKKSVIGMNVDISIKRFLNTYVVDPAK